MSVESTIPDPHPYNDMARAQWNASYDLAHMKALEFLSIPPIEDKNDPIYQYQFVMYPFAHAIVLYHEARELLRTRQDAAAAETLMETVRVIEQVDFIKDLMNPTFQMLRQLHLLARVRGMVARTAAEMTRGRYDQALREARRLEATYLADLITLSKPDQPPEDLHMRATAAVLLVIVLNAGALVYMKQAVMGQNLRSAKRYFEKIDKILKDFAAEQNSNSSLDDVARLSEVAGMRVEGEILASQDKFAEAVDVLDKTAFAFETLAAEFSAALGTSEMVRDFIATAAEETAVSIRHYERMGLMQSKLDAAKSASEAQRARMDEMERYHRDAMLSFARQELGVNVNTVVDVKNTVNIRNTIAVTVQDQAMDEVLEVLRALPESQDRAAAEQAAKAAKDEKDISAKIKKVAAVIEATAKIADGAAKLVPYGPAVMGVLKGLFALIGSDDSAETPTSGSGTTMV